MATSASAAGSAFGTNNLISTPRLTPNPDLSEDGHSSMGRTPSGTASSSPTIPSSHPSPAPSLPTPSHQASSGSLRSPYMNHAATPSAFSVSSAATMGPGTNTGAGSPHNAAASSSGTLKSKLRKPSNLSMSIEYQAAEPSPTTANARTRGGERIFSSPTFAVSREARAALASGPRHSSSISNLRSPHHTHAPHLEVEEAQEPQERRPRFRATPHLARDNTVPDAPPMIMYWSKAPVHGHLPPTPIRAHTATLIDQTVWLFGGCDDSGCFNDVWCFDTDSLLFTKPQIRGDPPPPMRAHSCTAVDRRLFIIGGGSGTQYFNTTYMLDTASLRWHLIPFSDSRESEIPPKRRAHTAVLYKDRLWVYGGGNGHDALSDVWTLNARAATPERMYWTRIPTTGRTPPPRGYHTANVVNNIMFIIGGSDGSEVYKDVFALNMDKREWNQVELSKNAEGKKRLSHSATLVGSYIFVFGGHNSESYSSNLSFFNLVNLCYEQKRTAGKAPSARGYHCAILSDARLFVFGGFNGKEVLDDVYMLDLSSSSYLQAVTNYVVDLNQSEAKQQQLAEKEAAEKEKKERENREEAIAREKMQKAAVVERPTPTSRVSSSQGESSRPTPTSRTNSSQAESSRPTPLRGDSGKSDRPTPTRESGKGRR